MAENQLEVIKGLMCPSCGGTVELAEGNNVLKCPYCDTSLLVMGDEGVLQYYTAVKSAGMMPGLRQGNGSVNWIRTANSKNRPSSQMSFWSTFLSGACWVRSAAGYSATKYTVKPTGTVKVTRIPPPARSLWNE